MANITFPFMPKQWADFLNRFNLERGKTTIPSANIDWYPQPILQTSSSNPVVVNPFEEAKNRLIAGKARGKRLFGRADVGYTGIQQPFQPVQPVQPVQPINPIPITPPASPVIPRPASYTPSTYVPSTYIPITYSKPSSYTPSTYVPSTYIPTTYSKPSSGSSQSYSWSRPPVSYAGSYAIVSRGF